MEAFAVDLLWLRPGQVGGTEFYIRNLLHGFRKLEENFDIILVCTKDNVDTFMDFKEDKRFSIITAPINNANIVSRILWQWFKQNSFFRKNGIKKCFTPVYQRPLFNGGISYINTIHDLQVYHYPNYHPLHEVLYTKLTWILDKLFSKHIIAISNFVKDDLVKIYHFNPDRITIIYNPITLDMSRKSEPSEIEEKYGAKKGEYYYSIGQLIPHKNFETLVRVFKGIKDSGEAGIPCKLFVSGINGNAAESVKSLIKENHLENEIILTGFVSEEDKIALYANCRAFLFPSVFEGFGMPIIEAMLCNAPVITTRCACIPEISQEKANYVENPYNENEWIKIMKNPHNRSLEVDFEVYDQKRLASKYMKVLKDKFGI